MSRFESALVAITLALLLGLVALDLSGHRLFVVVGSSMEPAIPKGALVAVRAVDPGALSVGDVVTFEHRGQSVTHRVASIDDRAGFRVFATKGDANAVADPERIAFDGSAGLVVAAVPLLGYPLGLAQSLVRPLALFLALGIAARVVWPALSRLPFPLPARA